MGITMRATSRAKPRGHEECARCERDQTGRPLQSASVCWWCNGILCLACFSQFGHCGHAEANLLSSLTSQARTQQDAFEVFYLGMLRAGKEPGDPCLPLRPQGHA